jgi:(R,R)-butanediol dehydrogenase/meso-butanediol dehydrogenase/diacetyl reductase
MRAVVLSANRPVLEMASVDDPAPGDREVLLRVTGCGICGSDLHVASQIADAGTILGHEIAGTIEAHGAGVDASAWPVGKSVVARPFMGCGQCPHCRRGRSDHCGSFELLGLNRPGGFAELTVVSADELFALPAAVSGAQQALVEPLAVAHRAVMRAGLHSSDEVVVLGGGPIGLAIVAWAQHLGAEHVTLSDPAASRRDLATRLGASRTLDPFHPDTDAALAGTSPSVVFECTGRPGMIQQAMTIAAVEARVVVVGVCLADDVTFPFTGLSKELDVRYAIYYGPDDFVTTIAALDEHSISAEAMITEITDLDSLPERFARLGRDAEGGKVILVP